MVDRTPAGRWGTLPCRQGQPASFRTPIVVPVFDQTLNATFCPAPVPRDSTIALWSTPGGLMGVVPATPASTQPMPDVLELIGPGGTDEIAIPCSRVPVIDLVSELSLAATSSRSVRALGHVVLRAFEIIARGLIHPDANDSGVDVWSAGPFGSDEMTRMTELGRLLPPESFAVGWRDPDRTQAVLDLVDCVADLLPRVGDRGEVAAAGPWLGMGHCDVSGRRQELRSATVSRRSVLQLRLVLPDEFSSSGSAPSRSHVDDEPDQTVSLWVFLRSHAHDDTVVAASDLWSGVENLGKRSEHDLLFLLRRAAIAWAPIGRLLDHPAPSRLVLTPDEVDELIDTAAGSLTTEGIEVLVPTDMVRRITATPRVQMTNSSHTTTAGGSTSSGLFTIDSLCDVTWTALAGDRELSTDEMERLLAERHRLIRLDDGWVMLDASTIEKLRQQRSANAMTTLGEVLGGHDGLFLVPPLDPPVPKESVHRPPAPRVDAAISGFITSVLGAMTDDEFPVPPGMLADLRPYQRAGVSWATRLFRSGFGGILADDMGLGKTLQMIALHLWANSHPSKILQRGAPTLIVAPTGLLDNWAHEFERWAPSVDVHRFHGPGRELVDVRSGDVVLTTYGVIRRDVARINELDWTLVIADEAQAFKNPDSGTARAISSISSGVRFALTGTPVENHLGELWSLFEWTSPGLLGSRDSFAETIAGPIERNGDPKAHKRLTTLTSPFMLRRSKMDERIAVDLPQRTITDHHVDATIEQITLYKAATDDLLAEIQGSTGMTRRGSILKLLTQLKEVANHPAHRLDQPGPLSGRSGKFDLATQLIDEIVDSGQSVVVFTQYVRMGRLLVAGLTARGHDAAMLHGGLSISDRTSLVERFQDRRFRALVVSLRAGGTGLNLTAATHVIHYDRWWNPAVENQASDRVWRIGQQFPVQVHRIMTRGTIEERIAELIDSKQDLADSVMGSSAWFTELDDQRLAELVLLSEPRSDDGDDPL